MARFVPPLSIVIGAMLLVLIVSAAGGALPAGAAEPVGQVPPAPASVGEMTKKPSPWIATSWGLPVDWNVPAVITLSIDESWTPSPTCAGLAPPWIVLPAAPPRWSWDSESLNVVRADL